jgi:hypothetical protein
MALKTVLLFTIFTFMPIFANSKNICDQSHLSKRIQYFISAIKKEKKSNLKVWFNHSLNEHPIFIIDALENPQCVGLWIPTGNLHAISVSEKPMALYDDYGVADTTQNTIPESVKKIAPEFLQVLKQNQLDYAFVFVLGSDTSMKRDLSYRDHVSYEASSIGVAIHEEFHFLIQHPYSPRLSKKVWTKFASQSHAEDEDLYRCYMGSDILKAIHRQEVLALTKAYLTKNQTTAVQYAKEFLTLRSKRYSLLPKIKYSADFGQTHTATDTCKNLEAIQELNEGVPKFIENSLINDLGLASRQQIANDILSITNQYLDAPVTEGIRPIQSYYHTAAIELSLIRRFYKRDFINLTEEISQPESKIILTDLLTEIIKEIK